MEEKNWFATITFSGEMDKVQTGKLHSGDAAIATRVFVILLPLIMSCYMCFFKSFCLFE